MNKFKLNFNFTRCLPCLRGIQPLLFYMENNKFNADSSKYRLE